MNLMIIDDDSSILESLKRALKPSGHKCFSYQNPRRAVEAYQSGGFDAVLTDVRMPEMDGIEVLKAVRAINPRAYVIILTGYCDLETAIQAINNGAYAFFSKPLNLSDLIATLNKLEKNQTEIRRREEEHSELAVEYSRLKQAYSDLKSLIGGAGVTTGGKNR